MTLLVAALAVAAPASADAPDGKVPPNQSPTPTAKVTVNPDNTVTVTVTGGWSWPTHGKDCNLDRAGAGVAVDWFDPQQPGNPLGDTDAQAAKVTIDGIVTPIFVGVKTANSRNAVDNVVHPTENDTGAGAVADISDPSQFSNWRGGCGVFSSDKLLDGTTDTVAHGNLGNAAPGDTDTFGNAFNAPVPPADATRRGAVLSHTYASVADVSRICVVTYDVHGTSAQTQNAQHQYNGTGVGIPQSAAFVTAGGQGRNGDNGVEKNAGTPLGNACPSIHLTNLTTTESPDTHVNNTISDTATLSGTAPNAGGTITFKLYSDNQCTNLVNGPNPPSVAVHGDGTYGNALTTGFIPTVPGTYYWRAFYSGDQATGTSSASSGCTDEIVNVLPNPQISVDKTERRGNSGSFVDGPIDIHSGDTVQYHFTVTNPGSTPLSVQFNDPVCDSAPAGPQPGEDTSDVGKLDPNETWTFTCQHANVTANNHSNPNVFRNDVTVTGTDSIGGTVQASDHVDANIVGPAIHVDKKERRGNSGSFVDGPIDIHPGDTVQYQFTVTNPGTSAVTVQFNDPVCDSAPVGPQPGEDISDVGKLDPSETWTFTCQHANVSGANVSGTDIFRNVVIVTGTDTLGGTAQSSDQVDAHIISPGIHVDKKERRDSSGLFVDGPIDIHPGDTVQYQFTVTNTGSTSLSVQFNDPVCDSAPVGPQPGEDTSDVGKLDPSETWTFTCQHAGVSGSNVPGTDTFRNVVVVTGTDTLGGTGTSTDQVDANIIRPGLSVEKKERNGASGAFVDGPIAAIVGDTVQYQITVTNTGNTPLAINFSDPHCDTQPSLPSSGDTNGNGKLDVGEAWVYTCSHVIAASDSGTFTNTGTACGTDVLAGTVCGSDSAVATVAPPQVPEQQLQGQQITPGSAKLAGRSGCVAKAFVVSVTGSQIQKVVFTIDGKKKATVTKPDSKGRYTLKVDPRKFRQGSHLLVATTTFTADSQTKPKTMRLRFSRCTRRQAPAFTGKLLALNVAR